MTAAEGVTVRPSYADDGGITLSVAGPRTVAVASLSRAEARAVADAIQALTESPKEDEALPGAPSRKESDGLSIAPPSSSGR
jgi:hypothetical protein